MMEILPNMSKDEKCQLEFDLDSAGEGQNVTGYNAWKEQSRKKYAEIAATWLLPVRKHVRVKLKWRPDELEGVLYVQQIPSRLSAKIPLKLRVDCFKFDSTEIEYCQRVNTEEKNR